MNYKRLTIIIFALFLYSCDQSITSQSKIKDPQLEDKYKNSGFALVYDDILKKEKKITKKIDNRALFIFHKNLKKKFFC